MMKSIGSDIILYAVQLFANSMVINFELQNLFPLGSISLLDLMWEENSRCLTITALMYSRKIFVEECWWKNISFIIQNVLTTTRTGIVWTNIVGTSWYILQNIKVYTYSPCLCAFWFLEKAVLNKIWIELLGLS